MRRATSQLFSFHLWVSGTLSRYCGRHALTGAASAGVPESYEGFAVRTLAELVERSVADLPYALACDAEKRSDHLQGPLLAVVEAVVQVEYLPLALRQVLLEHRLEEVPAGDRFDVFLDF